MAPALSADVSSLVMKPGREFAADSYVHRRLAADAPADPNSSLWVRSLLRQIREHYGVAVVNIDKYAPPLFIVGPDQPTVEVKAARANDPLWSFAPLQRQWLRVPLPATFAPSKGTDEEALVYQPATHAYWEFWQAEKTGRRILDSSGRSVDEWRAAWGGRIDDLRSSPGYFETTPQGYKFGTAATGLALFGGLITIADQRRGAIDHVLHLGVPDTRRGAWAFPAQRSDGRGVDADAIPEGATFRLPSNLDLEAIPMDPYARMLAHAAQTHGVVVRDTSGAVAFYAENPLASDEDDPYTRVGGILGCPGRAVPQCYADSNNRLRGFPWSSLQAVRSQMEP